MVPVNPHPYKFGLPKELRSTFRKAGGFCLKLTMIRKWILAFAATAIVVSGGLAGCSDNGTGTDGGESQGPIRVSTIIVSPKSPAPGDTIQLTAVIVSDSANVGLFPTVSWSASDGQLLQSDEVSVFWVAPTLSKLVTVSVTATNSINSSSASATVFVGAATTLVASQAGQPFLTDPTGDFLYIHSPDLTIGSEVFRYAGGNVSDVVPGTELGENLVISRSLTAAAYQIEEPPAGNVIEPINVYYNNLDAGTRKRVTLYTGTGNRRHQYYNPALSPDGTMMAYQGLRPGPLSTVVDSMDIFVYYADTGTKVCVTETHGGVRKNHLPTFSSDGNWLLFLSDRTKENEPARWEYYGLKIVGGQVETDSSDTVQITNTNSQLVTIAGGVVNAPLYSWNPLSPIIAMVQTNGSLLQVTMGASGGTSVLTQVPSRPREFEWSPDGATLAYTDGAAIYTVPAGGSGATLVHQPPVGDTPFDLKWSADQTMMVYRISRGSISWFEILDLTDPNAIPVVLTPSAPSSELSGYRRQMSLAPIWLDSNELIYVSFAAGGATPSIDKLDISGAIQ